MLFPFNTPTRALSPGSAWPDRSCGNSLNRWCARSSPPWLSARHSWGSRGTPVCRTEACSTSCCPSAAARCRGTARQGASLRLYPVLAAQHPTADEVYEAVSSTYPNISCATVYRNLKQFSETGVVSKIEISGGADYFDEDPPDHYHIRCIQCR